MKTYSSQITLVSVILLLLTRDLTKTSKGNFVCESMVSLLLLFNSNHPVNPKRT